MNVKVKICGIRRLESAQAAIDAGADFLGFNFVPGEKRFIHPLAAGKIIGRIKGTVKTVGIFQNNNITYVNRIARQLSLDYVQLHGNESVGYGTKIQAKLIKAIHAPGDFQYASDFFLLDREKNHALGVPEKYTTRLMLAGGLNAKNVRSFIKRYKPFAVDVARGIEIDGITDCGKIKEFIEQAKGAFV